MSTLLLIIVFPIVFFLGSLITVFFCCSFGTAIGVFIAGISSLKTPRHLLFVATSLFWGLVYLGLAWASWMLAKYICFHMGLNNLAVIIGAVFPGLMGLKAIPQLVASIKTQLQEDVE